MLDIVEDIYVPQTYLMNNEPFSQEGLMNAITSVLREANIPLHNLPTLHVLTGELNSADMLRAYKSVDAYVQPS